MPPAKIFLASWNYLTVVHILIHFYNWSSPIIIWIIYISNENEGKYAVLSFSNKNNFNQGKSYYKLLTYSPDIFDDKSFYIVILEEISSLFEVH